MCFYPQIPTFSFYNSRLNNNCCFRSFRPSCPMFYNGNLRYPTIISPYTSRYCHTPKTFGEGMLWGMGARFGVAITSLLC